MQRLHDGISKSFTPNERIFLKDRFFFVYDTVCRNDVVGVPSNVVELLVQIERMHIQIRNVGTRAGGSVPTDSQLSSDGNDGSVDAFFLGANQG